MKALVILVTVSLLAGCSYDPARMDQANQAADNYAQAFLSGQMRRPQPQLHSVTCTPTAIGGAVCTGM